MFTFDKIEVPLVRRVYPQIVANNIVSVQPLLGPTGLIHYLRYRYSQNKGMQQEEIVRSKKIKPKKYRSIDEPWETQ
jgi:hypothetical protein